MHMANRVRKKWTLEELHSLPDDGNKYELIHGELFVTTPMNRLCTGACPGTRKVRAGRLRSVR